MYETCLSMSEIEKAKLWNIPSENSRTLKNNTSEYVREVSREDDIDNTILSDGYVSECSIFEILRNSEIG